MKHSTTPRSRLVRSLAAGVGGALIVATPALTQPASAAVVKDLNGPRGITFSKGRLIVAEADGTFSKVNRRTGKVRQLGKVPAEGIAPALAATGRNHLFVLTPGGEGPGAATLYRYSFKKDRKVKVADIGRYQKKDPDPFDLEDAPRTSNPFAVAALPGGGALVADAEGNELLKVGPRGKITTVARIKPRTVESPDLGPEGPPAGTPMPSEGVATSVAVGSDGYWYVGELRGFPATPGTSQIWRIKPGSKNAVCRPGRPNKGACKRHADGFTSIVGMSAGPRGSLYVVSLAKRSWLAAESGDPAAMKGAVYKLNRNGEDRHQLKRGKWTLPGGVDTDRSGRVYVTNMSVGFFGTPGTVARAK